MKAIVDIGSNTIKLLIADILQGKMRVFSTTSRPVRLAEGLSQNKIINPQAMERARIAMEHLFAEIQKYKVSSIKVVATAAVREAQNAKEFLEFVVNIFGVPARILSGEEEARISMLGSSQVLNSLKIDSKDVVFLDHGGASTEIGVLQPRYFAKSFPIGAVKAFELLGFTEEAISEDLWKMRDAHFDDFFEQNSLKEFEELSKGRHLLLAAGGTLLQMAIAMNKKPAAEDVYLCSLEEVESFLDNLRRLNVEDRESKIKIEHGRADIMPAGVSLIVYLMKKFSINQLGVTIWGLRHGLPLDQESA